MSIVWKFLTLCSLLEWMNIDYLLNESATTIQNDTGATRYIKCVSIGTHSNPKGKERES